MKLLNSGIWVTGLLLGLATAFDCSAKELTDYNFEAIKGVHKVEVTKNTPPSTTISDWYLGVCQNVADVKECPANSDICGITQIKVDDKSIVSEIFGVNSNFEKEFKIDDSTIKFHYSNVNWGDNLVDVQVFFICSEDEKDANYNKLQLLQWNGESVILKMSTNGACAKSKDNKDNKKNADKKKPNEDTGESWGWFTWIFIFMVLFLSIYIIGGAWFQYNKGNSIDFKSALHEVLENFIDLLKGLPSFLKEIIEKFTGSSHRGEYSAV
ncbi:type II membrane protein [Scheffersomyces spartinae]|uniref:Autophagy-related protein 27 n=1 Tax=Scheffersomyces spartinae TaxID=45513 RepID=A0A9P7V6K7_9ASCO|nr:type II membrane protein [Scheffersomyces spartinae]KAG7192324.1 type II membrane protein [Scheffersomyces spartinae]